MQDHTWDKLVGEAIAADVRAARRELELARIPRWRVLEQIARRREIRNLRSLARRNLSQVNS